MLINLYISRPTYRFILFYTCGLTAVSKRIWMNESIRMFINLYIARPTYYFILMYTCGLTVVIKRICYVIFSQSFLLNWNLKVRNRANIKYAHPAYQVLLLLRQRYGHIVVVAGCVMQRTEWRGHSRPWALQNGWTDRDPVWGAGEPNVY